MRIYWEWEFQSEDLLGMGLEIRNSGGFKLIYDLVFFFKKRSNQGKPNFEKNRRKL